MTKGRINTVPRSTCPIACSLDVLGDRWTLLIVRELISGKRRFGQLSLSPEKIATNILADRLRHMEGDGIIETLQYALNPPRFEYQLTVKGKALLPVLQEIERWANEHMKNCAPMPHLSVLCQNDRRRVTHGRRVRDRR